MDNTHTQLLDAVRAYKMPAPAVELLSKNSTLVLTGATASGKDAIEEYIQKISNWCHVVTHTTRQIRPGEQNGMDYWFVSEDEMLKLTKQGHFIEIEFIHNLQ